MYVFHSAESFTISEYQLHILYSKLMLNIIIHQHMILRTKSEESVNFFFLNDTFLNIYVNIF